MTDALVRDRGWIEYYADQLANLIPEIQVNMSQINFAQAERKAFKLMCDGDLTNAIATLNTYCEKTKELDDRSRGWLHQYAARIAYYWGDRDLSQHYQKMAYSENDDLLRPIVMPPYKPLIIRSKQSEGIVDRLTQHQHRQGFLIELDKVVSLLVQTASSNQFEQALADLGLMLGFQTERPEKRFGVGPDVLWLLDDTLAMIIEAKHQKASNKPLTKEEHGQLLNSEEWFKKEYPEYKCIRVSVHGNAFATKQTSVGETKTLTMAKLQELLIDAKTLFEELCEIPVLNNEELITQCEKLLDASRLRPESLIEHYLVPFEIKNA